MNGYVRSSLLALAAYTLTSCHAPPRFTNRAPLVTPHFTLTRNEQFTVIALNGNTNSAVCQEPYLISNYLCDYIEKRFRGKDKEIIETTDLVARVAPIADANRDHILDNEDVAVFLLDRGRYNDLVDEVNKYFPKEEPRFKRR